MKLAPLVPPPPPPPPLPPPPPPFLYWNPLPRIAEEHLRPGPTPEGAESESPSVCSEPPPPPPEVWSIALKEWQRSDLSSRPDPPAFAAVCFRFQPRAPEASFWAVVLLICGDDRCFVIQWTWSPGPFREGGGGQGMTVFTAEPPGGAVGRRQWNICDGSFQSDNPADTLVLIHHLTPPWPADTSSSEAGPRVPAQPGLTARGGGGASSDSLPESQGTSLSDSFKVIVTTRTKSRLLKNKNTRSICH